MRLSADGLEDQAAYKRPAARLSEVVLVDRILCQEDRPSIDDFSVLADRESSGFPCRKRHAFLHVQLAGKLKMLGVGRDVAELNRIPDGEAFLGAVMQVAFDSARQSKSGRKH